MNFYDTVGGRKFIDGTMVSIKNSLEKLSNVLNKQPTQSIYEVSGTEMKDFLVDLVSKGEKIISTNLIISRNVDTYGYTEYTYVVITEK